MQIFKPQFSEFIPKEKQEGILYISMEYATASHLCPCGCGELVVTPLSPTGWQLQFDGAVSLNPSIGNWSLPCQSHYWIINNQVNLARKWTPEEIAEVQKKDKKEKRRFFRKKKNG
jgi:hypothetical protein